VAHPGLKIVTVAAPTNPVDTPRPGVIRSTRTAPRKNPAVGPEWPAEVRKALGG
jgi:hypothetical protein